MHLPILNIPPSAGDDALLHYELTPDEQQLFNLFDTAAGELPEDADLPEYHSIVAKLGQEFGLTPEQSIAFWTRTTFSMFEL